jgi:translocation and assembly module TamB
MTAVQKWTTALVIVAPVLVMAVLGYVHVREQVNLALERSEWVVADAVSRQIGRDVRIGKAQITPLGRLVLEDVAIAQGPSFSQGLLATARRVVATYDYQAMLFSGAGASGVGLVEVQNPRFWLSRRRDGSLNISDLFKPRPGPPRPPFIGRVLIIDGDAIIRDYFRAPLGSAITTNVRNLNVDVSAAGGQDYKFHFTARDSKGRFLTIRGTGVYSSATHDLWVDASGLGVDAAFVAKTIGLPKGYSIARGTLDFAGSASTNLRTRTMPHTYGMVRFRGASGRLPFLQTPIDGASGVAVLGGETVVLDASGVTAGVPVVLRGSINGFQRSVLDLTLMSQEVSLSKLSRAARLPAIPEDVEIRRISSVNAIIRGTTANPRIEAVASVPDATVRGYHVTGISVSLVMANRLIDLRSLEFDFRGARVMASGSVAVAGNRKLSISGQIRGMNLSRMPLGLPYEISGRASADFTVRGTVAKPVVSAEAVARDVRVNDIYLGLTEAGLLVDGRNITIRHARVTGLAGGSLTASGTYAAGQLDMHVAASGVQASSLGRLLKQPRLGGVLYVFGRVKGLVASPVFEGLVEGFGLRYDGQGVEYARASIVATRNSVDVRSAIARWYSTEIRLSGGITRQDEKFAFQTTGQVERLNLDRVFDLIERHPDVSGTAAGEFTASGVYDTSVPEGEFPLRQTEATGVIRLQDGTAFGYPVDDAVAQWTFRNNVLTLSETVIASEGARLTFGGSVYVDRREVDFDFGLANLDLKRISRRIPSYVSASGTANLSGIVSGPWDDVNVSVRGGVQGLVLNQMAFDQVTVRAAYSRDVVHSAQLNLARGTQHYQVSLSSYNVINDYIGQAQVKLTGVQVIDLWEAIKASPYLRTAEGLGAWQSIARIPPPTGGTIDATVTATGPVSSMDGSLVVSGKDLGFDDQKIDALDVSASAKNGVVDLQHLTATSGDSVLQATGHPLYDNGKLHLSLSVNNFDIARLKPFMKENTPSGVASVELEASGSAKSPAVTMSVEVQNPGFRGVKFDRLRAPRIEIANGLINFPEPDSGIILAAADHQIVTHGYIPWDWSTLSVPRDRQLEVAAELNDEDLSILSSFVPEVDATRTKGAIEAAAFKVGGTLSAPSYDGILRIRNGTLGLKSFTNDFQNVNVDMAFDGNRILINQFSAKSSLGGSVKVEPGSTLAASGADAGVNMTIIADALKLAERNAFGVKESISTQIDAGIAISGALARPLIVDAKRPGVAEGIVVSNALFKFAIPEKTAEAKPLILPVNPQFDVSIELGKGVTLQPPSMNLTVGGSGRLGGRYNDPTNPLDFRLELNIEKGSLYLAATRLRVEPGSVIMVKYVPPAAPAVTLRDFRATTSVMAKTVLNENQRYQVTVAANGPVGPSMRTSLSSNPPGLSTERMLAALGHVQGIFGTGATGLQNELASAVTATATSTLFRPIERVFTERLGFEQFSLDYGPLGPVSFFASTRLIDSVYISYFQRLQAKISEQTSKSYELKASYRFRRFYALSGSVDDQDILTYQLEFTRAFE